MTALRHEDADPGTAAAADRARGRAARRSEAQRPGRRVVERAQAPARSRAAAPGSAGRGRRAPAPGRRRRGSDEHGDVRGSSVVVLDRRDGLHGLARIARLRDERDDAEREEQRRQCRPRPGRRHDLGARAAAEAVGGPQAVRQKSGPDGCAAAEPRAVVAAVAEVVDRCPAGSRLAGRGARRSCGSLRGGLASGRHRADGAPGSSRKRSSRRLPSLLDADERAGRGRRPRRARCRSVVALAELDEDVRGRRLRTGGRRRPVARPAAGAVLDLDDERRRCCCVNVSSGADAQQVAGVDGHAGRSQTRSISPSRCAGHDDGDAELGAGPLDQLEHLVAAGRVEAVGRLVEEQQPRVVDERLGQLDALLHARRVAADRAGSAPRRGPTWRSTSAVRSRAAAAAGRTCGPCG